MKAYKIRNKTTGEYFRKHSWTKGEGITYTSIHTAEVWLNRAKHSLSTNSKHKIVIVEYELKEVREL